MAHAVLALPIPYISNCFSLTYWWSLFSYLQTCQNETSVAWKEISSFHFAIWSTFVTESYISNQDVTFGRYACCGNDLFLCSKVSAHFVAHLKWIAREHVWAGVHNTAKANGKNMHNRRSISLLLLLLFFSYWKLKIKLEKKMLIIFGRRYFCRKFLPVV